MHAHIFQPRPSGKPKDPPSAEESAEEFRISALLAASNRTGDPINHPPHYADTDNGVECIDAIQAALGREGFAAFLRGQIIKYQWRFGKKGAPLEDARKAQWYANKLVALLTKRKETPW